MKVVIGTRGSKLALAQSHWIRKQLLSADNGVDDVELQIIKTRGDAVLDVALSRVGGKGLFVKELEQALLDGQVDLAVHSLKDMPSALPPGLTLSVTPRREDPRDAWIVGQGSCAERPEDLPEGAIVGTSSLRRQAQLLASRPDLKVIPLRGNVDTRLAKLERGVDGLNAIVLAAAGLKRLGLSERVTRYFPLDEMVPAVGQGALAVEVRQGDQRILGALDHIHHRDTATAICAERAFMGALDGGCQVPIGGHAVVTDGDLQMTGFVALPDGTSRLTVMRRGATSDAEAIGRDAAQEIIDRGGRDVLERARA